MGEAPTQEAVAPVLTTHGLTKDFGGLRAVDGLDMEVCKGDVFGFLGPNGAGKTTFIRLVLGLIHPTAGHAEICGHRVPGERQDALRHVGGFVDDPTFYRCMSARAEPAPARQHDRAGERGAHRRGARDRRPVGRAPTPRSAGSRTA